MDWGLESQLGARTGWDWGPESRAEGPDWPGLGLESGLSAKTGMDWGLESLARGQD